MSLDGCVALPRGAMGLSAVGDCGISWSYSLFLLRFYYFPIWYPGTGVVLDWIDSWSMLSCLLCCLLSESTVAVWKRNFSSYFKQKWWVITENSEIFARILFSRIVLNHIFATLKIATRVWFTNINKIQSEIANSWGLFFHEFRENKILAKISEFTVNDAPNKSSPSLL